MSNDLVRLIGLERTDRQVSSPRVRAGALPPANHVYRSRRLESLAAGLGYRFAMVRTWHRIPNFLVIEAHRDGLTAEIDLDPETCGEGRALHVLDLALADAKTTPRNPLDDMPPRNPRDQVVSRASLEITEAVGKAALEHSLTYAELIVILSEQVIRWARRQARFEEDQASSAPEPPG